MTDLASEFIPYALDRLVDEADYAVIGPTDGRTRVLNTNCFPHSAVCHIERDFGDGRLSGCTAFLIGPTRLLTAGHCLFRKIQQGLKLPSQPKRIRVTPGRTSAGPGPFGSQWAKAWRPNPAYIKNQAKENDFGLIELAKPFSPSPGFFRIWCPTEADLKVLRSKRLIHISGYPGDKPSGTQWEHAERLDQATARRLLYSVDTCPGHSGSPVWAFRRQDSIAEVIAIHTSGPPVGAGGVAGCTPGVPFAPAGKFNSGVRMTPAVERSVRSGLKP